MPLSYNNRTFAPVENSATGEVGPGTTFHYRQEGNVVWATYGGGDVHFGTLIALASSEGVLDMRYHHVNARGELMTGTCRSTPELLPDGRIRLHEQWRWTCGEGSEGRSIIEEIASAAPTPHT